MKKRKKNINLFMFFFFSCFHNHVSKNAFARRAIFSFSDIYIHILHYLK